MRCTLLLSGVMLYLASCSYVDRAPISDEDASMNRVSERSVLPKSLEYLWRAKTLFNQYIEVDLCDPKFVRILRVAYNVDTVTMQVDWRKELWREEFLSENLGLRRYTDSELQKYKLLNFEGHDRFQIDAEIDYKKTDPQRVREEPRLLVNKSMKLFVMFDGENTLYQKLESTDCSTP